MGINGQLRAWSEIEPANKSMAAQQNLFMDGVVW